MIAPKFTKKPTGPLRDMMCLISFSTSAQPTLASRLGVRKSAAVM